MFNEVPGTVVSGRSGWWGWRVEMGFLYVRGPFGVWHFGVRELSEVPDRLAIGLRATKHKAPKRMWTILDLHKPARILVGCYDVGAKRQHSRRNPHGPHEGFQNLGVPSWGSVPIIRPVMFWGLYNGPPYLGKLPHTRAFYAAPKPHSLSLEPSSRNPNPCSLHFPCPPNPKA